MRVLDYGSETAVSRIGPLLKDKGIKMVPLSREISKISMGRYRGTPQKTSFA